MKNTKQLYHILLTVLILCGLTACSNTDSSKSNSSQESSAESTQTQTDTAQIQTDTPQTQDNTASLGEFTLEDWIQLCETNKMEETLRNNTIDYFYNYSNYLTNDSTDVSLSLTSYIYFDYEYNDEAYRLWVYYWLPGKEGELGPIRDYKLDSVVISKLSTEEMQLLWSEDSRYEANIDVTGFLNHISGFEQYVSYTLPEGLTVSDYNAHYGNEGGYIFLGSEGLREADDWVPLNWRSQGGIIWMDISYFTFEGDKIETVTTGANHNSPAGSMEQLVGCSVPTAIQLWEFDLYTLSGLDEKEEGGTPIPEDKQQSRYWYVFMAEEGGRKGYAFFMDADEYSKESVIELAQQIQFLDGAFR